MPRPKSEITGKQISIAVRVTASQKETFKQIGGATWLRRQLIAVMERRWQAEQPSLGQKIITRVFGR